MTLQIKYEMTGNPTSGAVNMVPIREIYQSFNG